MKNLHPLTKLTSLLATACLALAPAALAVDPPPDGGYPNANTAEGDQALFSLTTGANNGAVGFNALFSNTTGSSNTATGFYSLANNTTGSFNTAYGQFALQSNGIGTNNTAVGYNALFNNTTGENNVAIGTSAGINLTIGSANIDIGNAGAAGESNTIRIGTAGTQTKTFIAGVRGVAIGGGMPVGVSASGQFGVKASSARFKEAIKPMDKASEAIFSLQPVTFRYKKALDPEALPQFGLVAEQVAKVDPDLVARDADGRPYTVRYEEVNAMLLNEFLKEHRKGQEQAAKKQQLEATVAQQQTEIQALTAALKAQAAQIQKVSDQLRAQAPGPRVVAND
jgi:hypothetical protein